MTDIEEIILEGLDKQGILCQLKAQMRASVYKLIDSSTRQMKGKTDYSWENSKASQLTKNPQMKQILEIFIEFLQFYNLNYSLSVFKQEINTDYEIKRDTLMQKLNLKKTEVSQDESIMQFLVNDYFGGGRKNQAPLSFQKKDQNQEQQNLEVKLQGQENKKPVKAEKDLKQMKKQQEPKTKFEFKPITDKKESSLPGKNLPPLGGLGGVKLQQQQQQPPKSQDYDYDYEFDDSEESNKNNVKPVQPATKFNSFTQQNNNQFAKNQDKKDESISYEEEISESIQQYDDDFENPSKASGGSSSGLNQNQQQVPQNLPTNIQKSVQQQQMNMNQFASSEDYGSQSQGMDLTVDSVKLEEYDLVEEVQLIRKKPFGF